VGARAAANLAHARAAAAASSLVGAPAAALAAAHPALQTLATAAAMCESCALTGGFTIGVEAVDLWVNILLVGMLSGAIEAHGLL
jgi:hypothetical protein